MRALALMILTALPLRAQTADPLPDFDLDSAITCLAYSAVDIEQNPDAAVDRAEWMVFFSRLIAVKSTDAAAFEGRFAKEVAFYRAPSFEEGVPATPEEADEILTGTGKMCWFEALAAEGGPFSEP
ncbi:MAG: hypothetical protein ACKO1H_16785 [Tabrizicola sp.]